jgi:hypothetical protein
VAAQSAASQKGLSSISKLSMRGLKFMQIIFKNSVLKAQKTHYISITKSKPVAVI